ncbi:YheC/YheD family endospore coat-associated protein [Thermoactinomyces mirandus]|uniref:YheC/YheD family protein n=1 Tax=Thermoactinomyces mirandus TaxID=2756294 RepID=A0A7W1XTI5_9BACL|nr:YheC/YheD family protein [Thermoactinomyces mirandus]MBA4602800.1 YheC/YheD family protein [Thermoactinomyces mirandus]
MTENNKINTLGIMVCYENVKRSPPFGEAGFFAQLAIEGRKWGLEVCVFNPAKVNWKTRTVPAWQCRQNFWEKATVPVPVLVYDRCYYINGNHYLKYKPYVSKIINDPRIRLLGRALGGKYQTYLILNEHPEIRSYLPETKRLVHAQDIWPFLRKYTNILIKPNGGSHGRGVIAITRTPSHFLLKGRTRLNEPFSLRIHSPVELMRWIEQTIRHTRYIMQPLLSLFTPDHRPFDVRILVQKNYRKEWETTGLAIRVGKPNSVTSNLHGGGQAVSFKNFLHQHYPFSEAEKITSIIRFLSETVPPFIEQNHGPLVELGLDLGIDQQGHVWILEVNSKPGRSIFLKTGELEVRRRAVQFPIQYAYALLNS